MKFVRDETGHTEFDIYGHSLGGDTAVNVASYLAEQKKDEGVRSVILDGTCGAEDHDFLEMLGRTKDFGKDELWPSLWPIARNNDSRLGAQMLFHVFRNLPRTLAEGVHAGTTDVRPRLQMLGELGIARAAILSASDTYSPANSVERDSGHVFDKIYRREDPFSNHLAPQLDPVGTAIAIANVLDAMHPTALYLVA